jgi:methionyl aminopeptidase
MVHPFCYTGIVPKIYIKTYDQIDAIRKSCKLAANTLKFIAPHVVEGVTTAYLDTLMNSYIRDHGGIPASLGYEGDGGKKYPCATCISVNEVVCHGIPSEYRLKKGDILNVDVATILDGYYGDNGTMFSIPPISEEAQQLLDISKKCLDIGIKQVKHGNYFGNIGYEIGRYAMLQRVGVVTQFTGHGVGILFHETPQVCHIAEKDSGEKMKWGHVFTVEPMINWGTPDVMINEQDGWTVTTADGKLSAQYEHTVLCLRKGCEILTLPDGV